MRPAYLELRETQPGEFSVLWKTPMLGDARLALEPQFSAAMHPTSPILTQTPPGAAVQTWRFHAEGLRGQSLRIAGLEDTLTETLVRIEFADGTSWTHRLTAREPSALIPVRASALAVVGVYTRLGVEHILSGWDHLLFVLALLLLTRGGWKLMKTVTAFTFAHSLTLAAATLGFVHVPPPPVEAAIALSIVFVAAEIVNTRNGRVSFAAGRPWLVAFTFGLLHGLGFAGALSEIGLPQGHIPLALLFFNVGVESGQLLFIGSVLGCVGLGRLTVARACSKTAISGPLSHTLSKMDHSSTKCKTNCGIKSPEMDLLGARCSSVEAGPLLRLLPPYAIGSVAMFWLIQRIAAF
jgi:hydrogenase/urease accessory protein HupE